MKVLGYTLGFSPDHSVQSLMILGHRNELVCHMICWKQGHFLYSFHPLVGRISSFLHHYTPISHSMYMPYLPTPGTGWGITEISTSSAKNEWEPGAEWVRLVILTHLVHSQIFHMLIHHLFQCGYKYCHVAPTRSFLTRSDNSPLVLLLLESTL